MSDEELPPAEASSDSKSARSDRSVSNASEQFLAACGVCLVMAAVGSFATIIVLEFRGKGVSLEQGAGWVAFFSAQSQYIVLLVLGIVCALLGMRLLTTTQNALARTIPKEDLPMIQAAVIAGKSDPIDQYVRLRSLAGWAGTFTKLGITGLPLVTVALTLIFSAIALSPSANAKEFLDLAKLTLGAFIGSFVQRNVELRKQDTSTDSAASATVKRNLPV